VQKEVIDFLKAALADEQVKLDSGKSILFELNQSKVALSNAIAKSHMIAKDLKEAKTALILALGIDPSKESELVLSETDFPVQHYPGLMAKIKQVEDHPDMPLYTHDEVSHWTLLAKERKPEIKKAQYYLQAAAEQVKGRKARYLPTISAFADYGYYIPTNGVFFKQQNNFAGGVVLNWNIFDSFKREFEIQEYSALRRGARIALEQENDKTALRMRDLLFKIEEGIYTYISASESLKLAEEGMNDAKVRLSSGTITPLQYRDATRSFAEVRQQSDTAEYMLLQAYFQLLHDASEDI
jgi:outer membrane protein TolC